MENTALQLSDLKVSNLPELQGWKEKQEQLVSENPYVEITDNKTYEVACKSRTALLKGRTELDKQDKLIASKLTAFRKDVKAETYTLIAITLPSEEKQQAEVKRYEGIKEVERQERERIEQQRIDTIKAKIESIESESLAIIQKMTFQNIIPDTAAIGSICKQEFDFEEYDILFEQTLARIETSISDKIDDLNDREEQRIAKEQAEEENRKLKAKQDLQSKRLNELMPYVNFIRDVDMAKLDSLTDLEYRTVLGEVTALFEADAKNKKEYQDKLDAENLERENKAKADKEKIFEIRVKRLEEIGIHNQINDDECTSSFADEFQKIHFECDEVLNADAIEFETLFTKSKLDIEKSKEQELAKEQEIMLRIAKLLELGLKSPEEKDGYTIANDCDYFLPIEDYYNASEEEFDNILLEAKQAVSDYKLSKDDAERLKKENKARVNRLAVDKKVIAESFISYFSDLHLETENQEIIDFIESANVRIHNLEKELLTELEKL